MRKLLHIAYLLALPMVAIFGQNDKADFSAWLEVQSADGTQVISGWCRNEMVAPVKVAYRAVMYKGLEQEIKEGTTLALPGQSTLLLKAVFVAEDSAFEKVVVEVFDNQQLKATATLLGKTIPPPAHTDTPLQVELSDSPLPSDAIEIEGLILDETRSKLAHDFYELFYNNWSSDNLPGNYTILLREMPARAGLGSRVAVEVNGEELTILNLQPRSELLEQLATQLVEALSNHLSNNGGQKELETDDIMGSGIY